MGVINIGSINVDHFYSVPHLVAPGETLASDSYRQDLGGKGMNQSIALVHAGVDVVHVGAIGAEDNWLKAQLAHHNIRDAHIAQHPKASGHAIIQVDAQGENCIILHPGCNHALTQVQITAAFDAHPQHRYVLLQNETNLCEFAAQSAKAAGHWVVYNPAPMQAELARRILPFCQFLIVNEVELQQLTNTDEQHQAIAQLLDQYPQLCVVLTLGARGVHYQDAGQAIQIAGQEVEAVDTTAAGDTFIGYFLAALVEGQFIEEALNLANRAAALCVTRQGTSSAIPYRHELAEGA